MLSGDPLPDNDIPLARALIRNTRFARWLRRLRSCMRAVSEEVLRPKFRGVGPGHRGGASLWGEPENRTRSTKWDETLLFSMICGKFDRGRAMRAWHPIHSRSQSLDAGPWNLIRMMKKSANKAQAIEGTKPPWA
jgi:hypothetical protein